MKKHAVAALLAAMLLTFASCGGSAGGNASGGDASGGNADGGNRGGMEGMDHGQMGSGGMAAMSRKMVMPNGRYSDKAFIDAMVPHHEGAVEMAQVALKHAGHPEIEELAEDIVSAQEKEIKELKGIKQEEFGTSDVPMHMSGGQMRAMGMMEDPQQLADKKPFDEAFIDAMILHHESAIAMAEVSENRTDDPRIRELAKNIVSAQEKEIAQMKRWRQEWYSKG